MEFGSTPINILLWKLINSYQDAVKINEAAVELSARKHYEYHKITKHVTSSLRTISPGLITSLAIFKLASSLLQEHHALRHMQLSIFHGFRQYWSQKFVVEEQNKKQAMSLYQVISEKVLWEYALFFRSQSYRVQNIKTLSEYAKKLLEQNKIIRLLNIIKIFSLQLEFSIIDISERLSSMKFEFEEIEFYFLDRPHEQKILISKLVEKNQKMAILLIKKFDIDIKTIPNIIWEMEKKGLYYHFNNNSMHTIELKYFDQPQFLAFYVIYLLKNNKRSQAYSILHRNKLFEHPLFDLEHYTKKVEELKQQHLKEIPNKLLAHDYFGPTEFCVLDQKQNYLELSEVGIKQNQVHLIDSIDIKFQYAKMVIQNAKEVSFDCQMTGRNHTFGKQKLQLLQIGTMKQIFLFDIRKIYAFAEFSKLINGIFVFNKNIVIGHGIEGDIAQLKHNFRFQGRLKSVIDTQQLFQQNYPGKPFGLANIVQELFNKRLSKYEQCSNWNYKPLRRAQLHYAALDAYILLKIYNKLKR